MSAQINCTIDPCNAGARAGLEFLHALPDGVQYLLYVGMIAVVVCVVGALVARGAR